MELTPKQQVVDVLKNNQKFLILTHKDPDGDALGSILALSMALKRLGKEAAVISENGIPAVFNFLPEIESIDKSFPKFRDFIISLDLSETKADKVMYKIEDKKLNIIITPKDGEFSSKMLSCPKGGFRYDTIIVLDSPDLERLGSIYEENSEAFYEVPIVNIDHHPGNDHFGKINLVDLTATSTAEILVSLIEALTGDPKFFDEHIATVLLAGIITDTNSFQNTNTTPKSLTVAAQLVAAGAHQQEIIKNIYKTKPLSTLRLWGRTLSALHEEEESRFIWSEIFEKDYVETGATEDQSSGVIDELLKTAPGIDFALLLSEKGGDLHGSLRSAKRTVSVAKVAGLFGGGGHEMAAGFQINGTTLEESAHMVVEKIKEHQKTQTDNGSTE